MRKNNGFGDTKAIIHQMDDINVYPVTDNQLDELEKGSNSDLYLEISLCLVSVFASFLCSLIVLNFNNTPKAYDFYAIVCIVTSIGSLTFLLLWYRNRKSNKNIIKKIRNQKIIQTDDDEE